MRGRTKLVDVHGSPALYVRAQLRLEQWNGYPTMTRRKRKLTREQLAQRVTTWVAEQLASWVLEGKA